MYKIYVAINFVDSINEVKTRDPGHQEKFIYLFYMFANYNVNLSICETGFDKIIRKSIDKMNV